MLKLILLFVAWAAAGGLLYRYVSPTVMVVYAVVSLVAFLAWAATRKPTR